MLLLALESSNNKLAKLVDCNLIKFRTAIQLRPLPLLRQGFAVHSTKNALIKTLVVGVLIAKQCPSKL